MYDKISNIKKIGKTSPEVLLILEKTQKCLDQIFFLSIISSRIRVIKNMERHYGFDNS